MEEYSIFLYGNFKTGITMNNFCEKFIGFFFSILIYILILNPRFVIFPLFVNIFFLSDRNTFQKVFK